MTVKCHVAQYIPDLLRAEPRNVGVIVRRGDQVRARFVGETGSEKLDYRRVRKVVRNPETFDHWVQYWRSSLAEGVSIGRLQELTTQHFRLIASSEIADTEDDSLDSVCHYAFRLLVGPPDEARIGIDEPDTEGAALPLRESIRKAFRPILDGDNIHIPHPMVRDYVLSGSKAEHTASFFQKNGRVWVMEPIDLGSTQASSYSESIAFRFDSWREVVADLECVTLLSVPLKGLSEAGEYASGLLTNNSRVVNWGDGQQRREFVEERERIAYGDGNGGPP